MMSDSVWFAKSREVWFALVRMFASAPALSRAITSGARPFCAALISLRLSACAAAICVWRVLFLVLMTEMILNPSRAKRTAPMTRMMRGRERRFWWCRWCGVRANRFAFSFFPGRIQRLRYDRLGVDCDTPTRLTHFFLPR